MDKFTVKEFLKKQKELKKEYKKAFTALTKCRATGIIKDIKEIEKE